MSVKPSVAALLLLTALSAESAATQAGRPTLARQASAVTFVVDGGAGAEASRRACAQIVELLAARGWRLAPMIVHIARNPFDATRAGAGIALPADVPPADNAAALAEELIRRALAGAPRPTPVEALARTVAAHLAPADAARRVAWEREWLGKVARGDIATTVLPELLWRTGGDTAIRGAARGPWPESAVAALRGAGCDDPLGETGNLVLAALLDPALLSYSAAGMPPVTRPAPRLAAAGWPEQRLAGAEARFIGLAGGAEALAVEALRLDNSAAWVAVRYALTGEYDAIRLAEGAELAVPLAGVEWAAVVIVGVSHEGHASLNARALADFPQRIERWDFLAADGAATLAWATGRHQGLAAYVVEALTVAGDRRWSVERRVLIPVADNGESPYAYTFVDPDSSSIAAYRLRALTTDGLLAEIGSFPVPE